MHPNVGTTDRNIRIAAGIGIIAVGAFMGSWWGAIGIVPIATGLMRWCPAYGPLGISTCEKGEGCCAHGETEKAAESEDADKTE
ncbi:MAG: YgaP family membrane protein [Gammaproteobacteria bacterium]